MTTMHPPILLTTILMPSQEPEYERLPTLKPMSDSLENTTTMATTMSALSTNSHTTVQNQMPFQPISTIAAVATAAATATTESSDKLTTDYNTGDSIRFFCCDTRYTPPHYRVEATITNIIFE